MVNKVILVGNLGRDPELRRTQSGKPVTTFSMATSRHWRDTDGNRQEETEWHDVVCFAKLAEVAGQYLTTGRQVYVEGRIQTRSWDDAQSGERKHRTEIVCEVLKMLGQRTEPPEAAPAAKKPQRKPSKASAARKSRRKPAQKS